MKHSFKFFLYYTLFWLLFFISARIAFLLYQHQESFLFSFTDWLRIVFHGLKLDISVTGYILLFPAVLFAAASYLNPKIPYAVLKIYTFVLLIAFLLIILADLEIYKYWGNRLDKEPLRYIAAPREMLASSSFLSQLLFLLVFILLIFILFRIYLRKITAPLKKARPAKWQGILAYIFFTGFLILPIRGGTSVSVINTGSVYFHEKAFANHAAVNVVWNFGHSLVEHKASVNPYQFYEDDSYAVGLKNLYTDSESTSAVLKTDRPNIVIIILESFSAKLIEPLEGEPAVTPVFNELASEGVLFSKIYSCASRTDRGLAAILSGFPVTESIPILAYPDKTARLPYISRSLVPEGYLSSFTYGGEIDFTNMRSYLINGNFNLIMSDENYPTSERSGKWGIPDHIMFEHFYEEVVKEQGPFMKVFLTISNHEPFEIPVAPRFGDSNLGEKFFSAAHYTDSCLGSFIMKLKETDYWDNLLVVLISDHGARLPDYSEGFDEKKSHIPMLWIGGAVSKDTIVNKYGSQADLAVTLLRQMGIGTDEYILGKDLLSASSRSFAFYSYKNGIGMLTDSAGFGLDFNLDNFSFTYGNVNDASVGLAKAMQQYVFDRYLSLSGSLEK